MGNCGSEKKEDSSARATLAMLARDQASSKINLSVVNWWEYRIVNIADLSKASIKHIGLQPGDLPWNSTLGGENVLEASVNKSQRKSTESSEIKQPHLFECTIGSKGGKLTVQLPTNDENSEFWQFLQGEQQIKEGERFRLGRSVYKLIKLALDSPTQAFPTSHSVNCQSLYNPTLVDQNCRICLSASQTESNPLVSPCICTGTIKYTHLECLRRWLFGCESEEGHIRVNRSVCQLCQADMSTSAAFQRLQESLIQSLHKASKPYAVFEVHPPGNKSRSYFLANLSTKRSYSIGRSSTADIRDTLDTCISKIHAKLTLRGNKLYLKDCFSTHGTLVNIKPSLEVPEGQYQTIVYHNMLLQISNHFQ